MVTQDCTRRSFADALHYAPGYTRRCRDALEEALHTTPAYRDWRALDPGPSAPIFSRLAALPALTKVGLRALGAQAYVPHAREIGPALAAGEIELVATSGTTSDQVVNVWHQAWWDATEAASWALNAHARTAATGSHREAILTSPWCTGVPCEDGYLAPERRTVGRFRYLSERSDPSRWSDALMARMVDEINAFQPAVLEANPSFLARLSRFITGRGLSVRSPDLIVLTYEMPSALHLRQIRRVFTAAVASSYGSTEAGHVFMECEAGRMHQVARCCHVDFLPLTPEHGGPALGRILVTTFDNPWRSLVRFDVGDIVRLATEPCPCGRRDGLTLASIEGRTVALTTTPGGRAVTQGEVDRALAGVQGLADYQVVQSGAGEYRLRTVAEEGEPRRVAEAASAALRAVYGQGVAVEVEAAPGLAPDPPGKYRRTRALAPVDADALLDDGYAPAAAPAWTGARGVERVR